MTDSEISPPNGYELVPTDDGSFTFYSKRYDENCHSTAGALGETHKYFLKESGLIAALQTSSEIKIFEVGFGLGLNFYETWKLFFGGRVRLHYVSTEIDATLVEWFQKQFQFYFQKLESSYFYSDENITVEILIGDAREKTPIWVNNNPDIKFDFIFQDAFSPKKNPTLWEKSWFELLASISSKTKLVTYSASHSVRENLKATGWEVQNIKGFGNKRSATLASITL